MKKILFSVLSAAIIFCLTSCEPAPQRYNTAFADVFDTVTEFTAYCGSQKEFDKYSEAVHSELLRLHEIFDIYSSYGGVKNAYLLNEKKELEDAPSELSELIEQGRQWYRETKGQLNIALGSVLSLWHDCRKAGTVPDYEELRECAQHCDIEKIKTYGKKIFLDDPRMCLDFGALAKGYAAQKAAELARRMGLENFALSCGGNVVTSGNKPSGNWKIGIENPDGGILTTVSVSDKSVVTSGDYQRYFEVDGVRYHHIIDPKTLYPASMWHSVTVISDSSAEADALSTALFCLDISAGRELIEAHSAEALWVAEDGSVTRSDGFSEYE